MTNPSNGCPRRAGFTSRSTIRLLQVVSAGGGCRGESRGLVGPGLLQLTSGGKGDAVSPSGTKDYGALTHSFTSLGEQRPLPSASAKHFGPGGLWVTSGSSLNGLLLSGPAGPQLSSAPAPQKPLCNKHWQSTVPTSSTWNKGILEFRASCALASRVVTRVPGDLKGWSWLSRISPRTGSAHRRSRS